MLTAEKIEVIISLITLKLMSAANLLNKAFPRLIYWHMKFDIILLYYYYYEQYHTCFIIIVRNVNSLFLKG